MDDDLKQLEAELKRMRPAAPTPELVQRIERDLAQPVISGTLAPVRWIWAVAVPAAAAIAMWMAPANPRGTELATMEPIVPAEAALKPVRAENLLVAAQDEGFVTLRDGTTARRERLNFVDTITWRDPRTNASLTWTVPREEVRVVPVVFQ